MVSPSPLRLARLAAGLTLRDVAELAKISTTYVSEIERGRLDRAKVAERLLQCIKEETRRRRKLARLARIVA